MNLGKICLWTIFRSLIIYGPACCRCGSSALVSSLASAYTVEDLCHSDRDPSTVKGCKVKVESVHATTAVFKPTLACARHCSGDSLCIGYSFHPDKTDCYLHYNCGNPELCHPSSLYVFYRRKATRSECDQAGGVWISESKSCKCKYGAVGRRCERRPESCSELAFWGYTNYVYQTKTWIKPHGYQDPFVVSCRLYLKTNITLTFFMRNIQRKTNPYMQLSGTNKWDNCVKGFYTNGVYVNFWSGLENIRYLSTASNSGTLTLELEFGSSSTERVFMKYQGITIGDSGTNYAVSYAEYNGPTGNNAYFDPHDNCLPAEGRSIPFSTPDADNDLQRDRNCAELAGRGWWFAKCGSVPVCSLMGDLTGAHSSQAVWFSGKRVTPMATKAFFTHDYTSTLPGL